MIVSMVLSKDMYVNVLDFDDDCINVVIHCLPFLLLW